MEKENSSYTAVTREEDKSVSTKSAETAEKKNRVKELVDQIPAHVEKFYFDSENFKELMKVMAHFHRYSINNMLLIAAARPDATWVTGYHNWRRLGRQVNRGAKGIKIIAPAPAKIRKEKERLDPVTKLPVFGDDGKPVMDVEEIKVARYKAITVFDISDTTGKPFPEVGVSELDANVEHYEEFMAAIRAVSPVPIRFDEITSGAKGYYHLEDKEIIIRQGMSQLQTVKTCLHECVHACHHNRDVLKAQAAPKDKRTVEIEAEGSAMVVASFFGLDTSDYSIPYLGGYSSSREMEELKASLEMIRSISGEMIDGITERLEMMQKEREKEQNKSLKASREKQEEMSL